MIIDIPGNTPWRQINDGDLKGSIWSSRNIDLRQKSGVVSPTQKLIVTTLSGDTDNPTDLAVGFAKSVGTINSISSERWWAVAGTSVYESSSENGDFEQDDSGSLPVTDGKSQVDIKEFNSKLYVATDDTLYSRSGATYTTVHTTLNNGYKILEVYGDHLYIASDTQIDSNTTGDVLGSAGGGPYPNTLDFTNVPTFDNHNISCMRAASNGIWFGTVNKRGGRAKVAFWNGVTEDTIEFAKPIESGMAMAMTIKDDIPYVLDNRGVLSAYNGAYFEEVARMDFDYRKFYRFDVSSSLDRWIHHNGMQTINNEILMAINTRTEDVSDTQVPRTPSGIYAYNSDYGIYHKYSFTAQEDSTTVTDQGQLEAVEVGAIYPMLDDEENDNMTDQADFIVGYAYKSDNSTTKYVIAKSDQRGKDMNTNNPEEAGVVITSKIPAEQVQETWQKFYTMVKPFENTTDKIVVKYRTQMYTPDEVDITWVNTTSFTSTESAFSTIKTNFEAGVDYEVEGLQGDGAGFISHISNITEAGGTYTVTVDETITGATTNTAKVRVDRWKKLGEFTDSTESQSFKQFNPEAVSTWIQFKIYMLGDGIELERILSKSKVNQTY